MFCDDIVKSDRRGMREGREQAGEVKSGRKASARQIRLGVAFLEGPETRRVNVLIPLSTCVFRDPV